MNRIVQIIIGNSQVSEKKNFVWNIFGSAIYAFISMFLSICVIRIMGESIGGVFSIAITVSQLLMYIAYFEERTFQVTDTDRRYTFEQYHGAKVFMCMLMVVISLLYVCFMQCGWEKAEVIFLMCIYRMIDGYADLYDGEFQLEGRLYLSGIALGFRSIISSMGMIVSLVVFRNLVLSLCIAIVFALIGLYLLDVKVKSYDDKIKIDYSWNSIWSIVIACMPYFIGAFLWVYILSASRISVDKYMSNNEMAFYQILFMPVSVVNLFATFFFKPALNTLAELYNHDKRQLFVKKVINLLIIVGGFTIICMLGAFVLGIPVLEIVSGCDLGTYRGALVLLMLAGGFNSAAYFMYYVLTIMRKSKSVLIGYFTAAGLAFIITPFWVQTAGIRGATYSFMITVVYLFLFFVFIVVDELRKKDRMQ